MISFSRAGDAWATGGTFAMPFTSREDWMPTLNLTAGEGAMLREILTSYLSDLRMEIANTDSMDFRQGLKKREVFLSRLLQDLKSRRGTSARSRSRRAR